MKNCKKITSALLAVLLIFTLLTCVAGAAGVSPAADETSTTKVLTDEDLTYTPPEIPTRPEPTLPDLGIDISGPMNGISSMFRSFLESINKLFDIIIGWFEGLAKNPAE